jgi:predicted metal-dependent phosphotriesterase family hydrolase
VHAQNETNQTYHVEAARKGSWVSFDGVNSETIQLHVNYLQRMKKEKLLDHVLVSQDSGWYHIGEPNGGDYKDYNTIFTQFIPALKQAGFTQQDINTLFVVNPAKAFTIRIRKSS